jgi:predicted Zn-dependent protease
MRLSDSFDLNPNYVVHQIWYGQALYFARRYDDAITHLRRVAEMESANYLVHYFLWLVGRVESQRR